MDNLIFIQGFFVGIAAWLFIKYLWKKVTLRLGLTKENTNKSKKHSE